MGDSSNNELNSLDSNSFQNLIVRVMGFAFGTGLTSVFVISSLYYDFQKQTKSNNSALMQHIALEKQKVEFWDNDYKTHKEEFKGLEKRVNKVYYKTFPEG